MKNRLLIIIIILLISVLSITGKNDLVVLKSGKQITGTVVNYVPAKEVTIVSSKGKTHHFKISEISKMSLNVKKIELANGIVYENTKTEIIPGLSVTVMDNDLPLDYAYNRNLSVVLDAPVIEPQDVEQTLPMEQYAEVKTKSMPENRFAVSAFAGYYDPSFQEINDGIELIKTYYLGSEAIVTGETEVKGAMNYGLGLEMNMTPRLRSRLDVSYWSTNLEAQVQDKAAFNYLDVDYRLNADLDIALTSVMVSLLYDLKNSEGGIQPYLGIGMGLNHTSVNYKTELFVHDALSSMIDLNSYEPDEDYSTNDILFQLIAGVDYPLSHNLGIRAEAKYLVGDYDLEMKEIPINVTDKVNGFAAQVGLFYRF